MLCGSTNMSREKSLLLLYFSPSKVYVRLSPRHQKQLRKLDFDQSFQLLFCKYPRGKDCKEPCYLGEYGQNPPVNSSKCDYDTISCYVVVQVMQLRVDPPPRDVGRYACIQKSKKLILKVTQCFSFVLFLLRWFLTLTSGSKLLLYFFFFLNIGNKLLLYFRKKNICMGLLVLQR